MVLAPRLSRGFLMPKNATTILNFTNTILKLANSIFKNTNNVFRFATRIFTKKHNFNKKSSKIAKNNTVSILPPLLQT